jgi:hypothetical protein
LIQPVVDNMLSPEFIQPGHDLTEPAHPGNQVGWQERACREREYRNDLPFFGSQRALAFLG